MPNLNRVFLMGNLTKDIELRAAGASQVGRISLAINRDYKAANGEKREEVTFVECEAWGKTAEVMAKYLSKGRPVLIEGRLKLDQWDDKESGKKQSKLKVVVESFQFIDSKGGEKREATPGANIGKPAPDDDLPFDPEFPALWR